MSEIPDVLLGVLRKGDYIESLEAVRDRIGAELDAGGCDHCGRMGPRDAKDTAALLYRLTETLKLLDAAASGARRPQEVPGAVPGSGGTVADLQARARATRQRTGAGTQTTGAPTSVAKRQGPGRRPGAGRKAGGA